MQAVTDLRFLLNPYFLFLFFPSTLVISQSKFSSSPFQIFGMVGSKRGLASPNGVEDQVQESLGRIAFFMALVAEDTAQGIQNLRDEGFHATSNTIGRRREKRTPCLNCRFPEAAQDHRVTD